MEDLFYMFFAVLFLYGAVKRVIEFISYIIRVIKHGFQPEDCEDIIVK